MAEIYDFEPPKISGVSSFLNTVRVNFIHLCDRNRMIEEKNMNMTSRLPVLASTLGTLFTVCLALTLLGVGHYGLDTPLTHTLAGMTAIFFTLFLLSERFNPNPLLPRTSRHSSAFMIRLCTSAFGAVVCLPAFLLMLWLMKNAYGFGALNLLMAGIPVVLLMPAGYMTGKKITRSLSADKCLLAGFGVFVTGQGIIALSLNALPFWWVIWPAMLLSALGAGLVYHVRDASIQAVTRREEIQLNAGVFQLSALVTLALLIMLLKMSPGTAGVEHGYFLMIILALAGVVTALMAQE